jgi:hypothetical protein
MYALGPRAGSADAPTVASLGLRVRLVPAARERERAVADLITSCERLRGEWEALFQQVIDLLELQNRRR